jgi:hypothetical protein
MAGALCSGDETEAGTLIRKISTEIKSFVETGNIGSGETKNGAGS